VRTMSFRDRADAGRRLAERLEAFRAQSPVILGLPRGGVPVAAEVAQALDAPLDVLIVRKLGVPWHPELGFGAIGEGGIIVLNRDLVQDAGLTAPEIEEVTTVEQAELERRVRHYREGRPAVDLEGRTVIVVDDGIATGFTVRAAVEVARRRGAGRVVVAVPVASPRVVEELRSLADEVIVLEAQEAFVAVGQFFWDFPQTSDEEVTRLLSSLSRAPVPLSTVGGDPVRACEIELGTARLAGDLATPGHPIGIVVFAHGSGSSRFSPRNRAVALALNRGGLGTLLFDLLMPQEELDRSNVFDIRLLTQRLMGATRWLQEQPEAKDLPVGYFGASTGAAAALVAAAELAEEIGAVVSRGGRPDLAGPRLADVRAPTLLIVGGHDEAVLEMNRSAQALLHCPNDLAIVVGATHLFEEPGALDQVATLAVAWFTRHLAASDPALAVR
jgi:putative phosphoribosyl transferase